MSVDRDVVGMAILEKCGGVVTALEELGQASAAELAERVEEPVSSTYRLLSALMRVGWVDPGSRRGLFRLGVHFVRLGSMLEDQINVRDVVHPALKSLRANTGCTAFLCYLRGDVAVCVDRLDGRDVQSLAMRLGDSLPLFHGAAPLALFANIPATAQDALFGRLRSRRAAGEEIPPESVIRERLEQTRAQGYSVSDEDVTPGIAAVGAPVFNHRGELEGAISVSGLRGEVLHGAVDTAALVVAAGRVSSASLGYNLPANPGGRA